jgi:hypothetical protein
LVADPRDQPRAATGAESAGADVVAQVADVDVCEAVAKRDAARTLQGRKRRGGVVQQTEVGVKRREVQWHIGAQVGEDPAGHLLELAVAVVFARDEQGGDFQPDLGARPQIHQGVEHAVQIADISR